ncbi:UNVERIFIED_CONTAM: TPP-dependent indolepyruvate ferredoxin oxidoreductase alpha subunit [Paenibacillus sp. PvR008]
MDNRTTAMTGKQPHPGNGRNLMESGARPVDIYGLVQACGVQNVHKVDPFDLEKSIHTVREAVQFAGPSVVIFESPCVSRDTPK